MEKSRKSGAKPVSRRKTGPRPASNRARAKKPAAAPSRGRLSGMFKGLGRVASFLLYWGSVAAIWGGVAVGGIFAFYAYDLPDVDAAFTATRRPAVTILAADGSELATVGDMYGMPVQLNQ